MGVIPSLVLGIETSCDETAAALFGDDGLMSNVVSSQLELHREYGGVVPELASRKHLENILPVIDEAFCQGAVDRGKVTAIAVTFGPGLVGALVVGLSAAKALAYAWGVPLIGVHHLEGHIYANFLKGPMGFPLISLVVSGGHTEIILMRDHGDLEILGRTRDDAAGEAFDKVARVLGLSYPGGPAIDRIAARGNPKAFRFPRSYLEEGSLDFSFSGIKTSVAYLVGDMVSEGQEVPVADIAAAFREAVVEVLVEKTMCAVKRHGITRVIMAGGVAANSLLREEMARAGGLERLEVSYPPKSLCTDNAAMIACAGYYLEKQGRKSRLDLDAEAGPDLGSARDGFIPHGI